MVFKDCLPRSASTGKLYEGGLQVFEHISAVVQAYL